jgi:hypothetical protein
VYQSKIERSHFEKMGDWVDLGEEVSHIGLARGPNYVEEAFLDPVFNPIVTHVDGL